MSGAEHRSDSQGQEHDHEIEAHADHGDEEFTLDDEDKTLLGTVATVGAVGVGVALFEAALLPGVVLGVAAMAAPKVLPRFGAALTPLFKTTVRGVYKLGQKTKEVVAETQEQFQDIVAEVDSEGKGKAAQQPTPKA
ncbi:DUF5132 domain-containing protein [Methylocystis parvus]|uniref:DUF5132 domain-containing protein n=1 Tax=Methylocystis parvus TaxID=134 RepID=A0A6B8MBY0_9HYPH|nr:DUF5132 domain-containing protein [Methylocystis parvus]QGM99109.1 DUF5132 domain-containing protein [Methylocystis parvus]WBK00521.1 DUF5132 domain-containing protein [Methylocystis parvus OBBP]